MEILAFLYAFFVKCRELYLETKLFHVMKNHNPNFQKLISCLIKERNFCVRLEKEK